jgi:DNA transformation protein and related proteins
MRSTSNEFADYVVELMASWAPVTTRKMFGGFGLYREGMMFALIADDRLYFKSDGGNRPQFERADSQPFVYTSQTRTVQMSYWSAPDASMESAAEMNDWCQSAYGAALRTHAVKAGKHKKGKRK